jgi:hypothetical protein
VRGVQIVEIVDLEQDAADVIHPLSAVEFAEEKIQTVAVGDAGEMIQVSQLVQIALRLSDGFEFDEIDRGTDKADHEAEPHDDRENRYSGIGKDVVSQVIVKVHDQKVDQGQNEHGRHFAEFIDPYRLENVLFRMHMVASPDSQNDPKYYITVLPIMVLLMPESKKIWYNGC